MTDVGARSTRHSSLVRAFCVVSGTRRYPIVEFIVEVLRVIEFLEDDDFPSVSKGK